MLTQNNTVSYNLETVTSDSEFALIQAINDAFPQAQRIGCYYHYINDIKRNLAIYNLNKNELYETFFKEISKVPLIYKGNIKYSDEIMINFKENHKNFLQFIDKYFIKNKRIFFVDKIYDYYHIPNDIRSNSYLENYSKYIKGKLGENRIVNWFNFINFLKNESKIIKEKIYKHDTQNIRFSQKKSKFNYKKYNEVGIIRNKKNFSNNNINWIKYKTNSCRYDSFLTLFSFSIDDKYLKNSIESNCKLINTCKELLKNPDNHIRFYFWKYLSDLNLDINNTNKNEDNYKKFGYISQLFSILNDNENFCILEEKILSCNKCNKDYNNLPFYRRPLIIISSDNLDYKDISSIFIDKKYTEAIESCPNCANTKFLIKTC